MTDAFFPFSNPIHFGDMRIDADTAINALESVLTPERKTRIAQVISSRCFDVAIVLDQLCDLGNQAAVLRTSEAFGFANVHLTSNGGDFKAERRVTRGANKWIEKTEWDSSARCCEHLLAKGYQILVTAPDATDCLHQIDVCRPTAIVFGNERVGIDPYFEKYATARISIPMFGFVESLNISVAAGILLSQLRTLRIQHGSSAFLSTDQQHVLKAIYYLRSSRHARRLLLNYLQSRDSDSTTYDAF